MYRRIRLVKAAAYVGVHPATLRRWAHGGLVRHYLMGPGRYMEFEERDLDDLIASMRREQHTPPID